MLEYVQACNTVLVCWSTPGLQKIAKSNRGFRYLRGGLFAITEAQ
jgi:hypothetical protein